MHTSTDPAGKTALVTGATCGVGFHTAAALVRLGLTLFVTGRDAVRGRTAGQQLQAPRDG